MKNGKQLSIDADVRKISIREEGQPISDGGNRTHVNESFFQVLQIEVKVIVDHVIIFTLNKNFKQKESMTTNLLFQVPDYCGEHFQFAQCGLLLLVRLPVALSGFLHLGQHGVDDVIGVRVESTPIPPSSPSSADN